MNANEAGGNLALIQTSVLFLFKCQLVNQHNSNLIYTTKAVSYVSKKGHLQPLYLSKARSSSSEIRRFFFRFFFQNKYFFNLRLLTLLLPFLSDQLGETRTIRPFAFNGRGSTAHEAKDVDPQTFWDTDLVVTQCFTVLNSFQLSAISSVAILNDTQRAALQYVITCSAQDSKRVSSKLLARVQGLGYSENDLKRYVEKYFYVHAIIV